jgi:hypothetical protein
MKVRCFSVEEIAGVESLEPNDPRRQHVESCPRCSVMRASYLRFLDPAIPAADRAFQDAERRLGSFLDRAVESGAPAETTGATGRPGGSWLDRLREAWRAPALRPAWALAGLAVLLAAGAVTLRLGGGGSIVLRGSESPSAGRAGVVQVESARALGGGSLELRWRALEGADAYRVEFYGADLAPWATREAGQALTLKLAPGDLPPDRVGQEALWRVVALRRGAEVGRSSLEPLRLP